MKALAEAISAYEDTCGSLDDTSVEGYVDVFRQWIADRLNHPATVAAMDWRINHYGPGGVNSQGKPYSRFASRGDAALDAVRLAIGVTS